MNLRLSLAFGLTVLLSTFSVTARAEGPLLMKSGEKVVFMGDSITEQGWNVPGGYVKLFVSGLGTLGVTIEPSPAGIGGQTSREMLARVQRDVIDKKPDWLTLSCGVNDVWHGDGGVGLEQYKKNITSIVDQAQAAGIKVILLTSTPIGEDPNDNNKKLVAYNDFLHQLAQDRKLPLADENAAFQSAITAAATPGVNVLTGDGVHPIPDGHQLMASILLTTIGVSPADLTKIQTAWLDAPASASIGTTVAFHVGFPITIRQYNALKKVAGEQKISVDALVNKLFVESIINASKATTTGDPAATFGTIETEAQKGLNSKIEALTKP